MVIADGALERHTQWDGDVSALDLDAVELIETRLLVRQELTGPTGSRTITILDDYEETQGILSPRTIETKGAQSYTLRYTKITYDVVDRGAGKAPQLKNWDFADYDDAELAHAQELMGRLLPT